MSKLIIRSELIKELFIMKSMGLKPNFSDLERKYGINRHTIKKYYEEGKMPTKKKIVRISKWAALEPEIIEAFSNDGVTKMGVYQMLCYKYGDNIPGTYNGFKSYTLSRNLAPGKVSQSAHVFYETDPGDQLQFDWKESLSVHLKNGELIEFNVFNATLGYSRLHIFIYSKQKTEEDFLRCIIEVFRKLGGFPKRCVTDNMTAIVSRHGKSKQVHQSVQAFFKDIDVRLELCRVRTPETKGKCESANRFINWIKAFDYQLDSEDELIRVIQETITNTCNTEINQRTQMPPLALFKKEKEYLKPIGNNLLLENYINKHKREIVKPTLLVSFEGKGYSVPGKYIGKTVDIYLTGNELYIYYSNSLVTVHTISQSKETYKDNHYKEALKNTIRGCETDIERLAQSNLDKLKKLGGN